MDGYIISLNAVSMVIGVSVYVTKRIMFYNINVSMKIALKCHINMRRIILLNRHYYNITNRKKKTSI